MTKREKYEKIIRETPLQERLDKCQHAIGKMCSERRPPKMTIPAQWYDEDIYISTTLMDAKAEIEKYQWIPVEERLPEPDQHVFIYRVNDGDGFADTGFYHDWDTTPDHWASADGEYPLDVSHWMPIPPLPMRQSA